MINQPLPITLNFSDIYSFSELEKPSEKLKSEQGFDKPGIYIWGFVFERGNDGLPKGEEPIEYGSASTFEFDPKSHLFIPYYVGKIEGSIKSRLKKHKKDAPKRYLMLKYPYLKTFYSDCKFPSVIGKSENKNRDWFLNNMGYFSDKILYYKSGPMLENIYKLNRSLQKAGDGYSVEALKNALNFQHKSIANQIALETSQFFENKQFFTFATFQDEKAKLKMLEAYVFYSLKGKTVSDHDSWLELNKKLSQSSQTVNLTGKHSSYLFTSGISECFPGY